MSVTRRDVAHQAGVSIKTVSQVVNDEPDIAAAPYYPPLLTPIYPSTYELGRMGIRLLIDCINGRLIPPDPIRLPTKLVIRSSCGQPTLVKPLA